MKVFTIFSFRCFSTTSTHFSACTESTGSSISAWKSFRSVCVLQIAMPARYAIRHTLVLSTNRGDSVKRRELQVEELKLKLMAAHCLVTLEQGILIDVAHRLKCHLAATMPRKKSICRVCWKHNFACQCVTARFSLYQLALFYQQYVIDK